MKKLMWVLAMIPVIVTSIVFQFIPDRIPMHHDLAGNVDRWGNKWESFIFPVAILLITLFWNGMLHIYEKKAVNGKTEKERVEAKTNAKVLGIVGISQAVMFGMMHFAILYSSCVQANLGSEKAPLDISKVSCALCGIMFLVLGNFMTKTKKNSTIGVRTIWSQYNDNAWKKSNRMGGISFIIVGLLTIITTAFADGMTSTLLMLAYLIIATLAIVLYSKKVYDHEKKL